jgi:hypothetical protein
LLLGSMLQMATDSIVLEKRSGNHTGGLSRLSHAR